MEAGIDDVGIGVLFGLYDWKFEVLALLQHIRHLEERFGVGPHTISVPRIEPAIGSDFADAPRTRLRTATSRRSSRFCAWPCPTPASSCPRAKLPSTRRATFELGVSRISAGSRTQPGRLRDAARPASNGAVPTGRPPLAGRGGARRGVAGLHAVLLHGLLPAGPHRRRFHGHGEARLDQAPLRPQRAVQLHGIPAGLCDAGDAQGGRKVDR